VKGCKQNNNYAVSEADSSPLLQSQVFFSVLTQKCLYLKFWVLCSKKISTMLSHTESHLHPTSDKQFNKLMVGSHFLTTQLRIRETIMLIYNIILFLGSAKIYLHDSKLKETHYFSDTIHWCSTSFTICLKHSVFVHVRQAFQNAQSLVIGKLAQSVVTSQLLRTHFWHGNGYYRNHVSASETSRVLYLS